MCLITKSHSWNSRCGELDQVVLSVRILFPSDDPSIMKRLDIFYIKTLPRSEACRRPIAVLSCYWPSSGIDS